MFCFHIALQTPRATQKWESRLYTCLSLTDGISNRASVTQHIALACAPSVWNSVDIISAVDTVVESDLTLLYWHSCSLCKDGWHKGQKY